MYKINNNLAPQYLCDLFEMCSDDVDETSMVLRSRTNMNCAVPKPRNNLFKTSLSYSGALIWNSIPVEIRNACSLNIFSNNCQKWMHYNN